MDRTTSAALLGHGAGLGADVGRDELVDSRRDELLRDLQAHADDDMRQVLVRFIRQHLNTGGRARMGDMPTTTSIGIPSTSAGLDARKMGPKERETSDL